MPTKKPRVMATVSPVAASLLDRYATVTGTSRSAFVAGLVEQTMPMLENVVFLMERAKQAEPQAMEAMRAAAHEMAARAEKAYAHLAGSDLFGLEPAPALDPPKLIGGSTTPPRSVQVSPQDASRDSNSSASQKVTRISSRKKPKGRPELSP